MTQLQKSLLAAAVGAAAVAGALALATWAPPVHAAGRAEVRFVEPQQFADIGRHTMDRERTLAAIGAEFDALARRLPDGQTLRVEVLDIDLAGELRPFWHDVRVVRGMADSPRLTLRWSLQEGGRTLRSGDERLVDLGYRSGLPTSAREGDFVYERRLLGRWFEETVLARR